MHRHYTRSKSGSPKKRKTVVDEYDEDVEVDVEKMEKETVEEEEDYEMDEVKRAPKKAFLKFSSTERRVYKDSPVVTPKKVSFVPASRVKTTPMKKFPIKIEVEPGNNEIETEMEAEESFDEIYDDEEEEEEIVMPEMTMSGERVKAGNGNTEAEKSDESPEGTMSQTRDAEKSNEVPTLEKIFWHVYSSFPCQIVPDIYRLTRTPVDGEKLAVRRMSNGRLHIYVVEWDKKFSPYCVQSHLACTVCGRKMKESEMHLNFPSDLDRRRIWANLLGFKYKDILHAKMGPLSCSLASGPICTEHFTEECFRNHNFNKAAIEAYGVPAAVSPDVKTTPTKKRVPWPCTICEFNSCSVVELQFHLLEHIEDWLKKKRHQFQVPPTGFMCPFCRKCTYGYRTISGFRRHLISPPIQHCHLRRIFEFAKINCRSSELEPQDSWEKWTQRNVYVAYHGCEPPIDEIILTPSPTKSKNPFPYGEDERSQRSLADAEKRRKAVRSLAFTGAVLPHVDPMQRAVRQAYKKYEAEEKKRELEAKELEIVDVETEEVVKMDSEEVEKVEEEKNEVVKTEDDRRMTRNGRKRKLASTEEVILKKEDNGVETEKDEEAVDNVDVKTSKKKTGKGKGTEKRRSTSVPQSPVVNKEEEASVEKGTKASMSLPSSPEKAKLQVPKIDEAAFARMIASRAKQVRKLINAKMPTRTSNTTRKSMVPIRKVFTSFVAAQKGTVADRKERESSNESKKSSTPEILAGKEEDLETNESAKVLKSTIGPERFLELRRNSMKMKALSEERDERPLKSSVARSIVEGRVSMNPYKLDYYYGSNLSGVEKGTSPPPDSSKPNSLARLMEYGPSEMGMKAGSGPKKVIYKSRVMVDGLEAEKILKSDPASQTLVRLPCGLKSSRPSVLRGSRRGVVGSGKIVVTSQTGVSYEQLLAAAADATRPTPVPKQFVEERQPATPSASTSYVHGPQTTLVHTNSGSVLRLEQPRNTQPKTIMEALNTDDSEAIQEEYCTQMIDEMLNEPMPIVGGPLRVPRKVRNEMSMSKQCIRQLEAAQARARLFGNPTTDSSLFSVIKTRDGPRLIENAALEGARVDSEASSSTAGAELDMFRETYGIPSLPKTSLPKKPSSFNW